MTKIKNSKFLKIAFLVIILLGILIVVLKLVILPNIYLQKANKYFDKENYDLAIKYYLKVNDSRYDTKIREAYFNDGKKLIEEEKYDKAKERLEKSNYDEAKKYITYINALIDIKNEKYDLAINALEELNDFLKSNEYLIKANYLKAESMFLKGEYGSSKKYYEKANDYEDAKTKITAADLMLAEDKLKSGELGKAKTLYESLPNDFSFNNIKVQDRLDLLNKYNDFVKISGYYEGTNGKVVVRQTHDSTGLWDEWSNTYTHNLTIKCIINDDGTVTIKGKAGYYTYTNYSSLSKYLKSKELSLDVDTTVSTVPSTVYSSDIVKLTYSNSKFKLNFDYKDSNSSMNFTYRYKSSITYNKKSN